MITAVLINKANVRLGQHRVGDDCRIIQFGGGIFYRTDEDAVLGDTLELGVAFEQTIIDVVRNLDKYEPRSMLVPNNALPTPGPKERQQERG